jgi:xylulokinase
MDKLPRIVEPWTQVGEVRDQAARDFGLAPGTLIAAGAGDTAANALGAGIVRPGMLFDNAGTASVLAGCCDRFVADTGHRALLTMRSVIPGLWHPLAYIAGGGLALHWFRDRFYAVSHGQAQQTEAPAYEEMEALAVGVAPGCEGLLFSPHLGGRVCPSAPEMRGAWMGFSWNHTQAHFYRAVLESVAFEYAYYLSILREMLPDLSLVEARVVGGGANGAEWNRIKASVLGTRYVRLARSEFGAWGSALIAGKAAGLFGDLAETAARHALPLGQAVLPVEAWQAAYRPLVERYNRMQTLLANFYQE